MSQVSDWILVVLILLSDQTLVFEFGSICVNDRQVRILDCQVDFILSSSSFYVMFLDLNGSVCWAWERPQHIWN